MISHRFWILLPLSPTAWTPGKRAFDSIKTRTNFFYFFNDHFPDVVHRLWIFRKILKTNSNSSVWQVLFVGITSDIKLLKIIKSKIIDILKKIFLHRTEWFFMKIILEGKIQKWMSSWTFAASSSCHMKNSVRWLIKYGVIFSAMLWPAPSTLV